MLAVDVSQDPSDVQLFEPMNDKLTQTLAAAGITAEVELELADAGYCSEHNLTNPGPDRLIATTKRTGSSDAPPANSDRPTARRHPASQRPKRWNTSCAPPKAHAAYKQRSQLIEPVFGDRKHNRHIRRFRRRGMDAARSEWAFIHLAGNILKLYQHHSAVATRLSRLTRLTPTPKRRHPAESFRAEDCPRDAVSPRTTHGQQTPVTTQTAPKHHANAPQPQKPQTFCDGLI